MSFAKQRLKLVEKLATCFLLFMLIPTSHKKLFLNPACLLFISRLTIVSCKAKKKQAVRDKRDLYVASL